MTSLRLAFVLCRDMLQAHTSIGYTLRNMMNGNCIRLGFAAVLLATAFEANCLAGPPTAWEEVTRMGSGINLGNTFDAPDGEGTWCRQPAQAA